MRLPVLLVLVSVMLSLIVIGCTSTKSSTVQVLEPNPTQLEPQQTASSQVKTLGLSFNRTDENVLTTDTKLPDVPKFDFVSKTIGTKLVVHYFYLPQCSASQGTAPLITTLESKYPNVVFVRYDLTTQNGSWAYQQFSSDYNLSISQRLVPQVLVNGKVMTDKYNISENLEAKIKDFLAN